MKQADLEALFCEISSRCAPIRGIYSAPSTERERIIQRVMQSFLEKEIQKKEKTALTLLFNRALENIHSKNELVNLLQLLQHHYHPKEIPDAVYIRFISIANTYDCAELVPDYFYQ